MSSNCLLLKCFVFSTSEFTREALPKFFSSPVLTMNKVARLTGAEVFHVYYLYLLPKGLLPEILVLLGIEEGGMEILQKGLLLGCFEIIILLPISVYSDSL